MKFRYSLVLLGVLIVACCLYFFSHTPTPKEDYQTMIEAHPYSQRGNMMPEELKAIPKKDRPDLAWEQDFLSTIDPALGRPAPERLAAVYQLIQAQRSSNKVPGVTTTPWVERGPTNVGGRTRAIMFDPNDATNKKVWAGGVTGGLWYNNDITSSDSSWHAVDDFWANLSVTAIAYDPTNTQVFYVGTGEGWGAGASRGEGIWKTTNGGSTWTQLSNTSSWYYVNDLIVKNESGTGVLYVACRNNYYNGQYHGNGQGLQRSINGGTSFTQVLPTVPTKSFNYAAADIELASNGRIWVGTQSASYGGGGGTILYSDNGTTWNTAYTSSGTGRVELACAPSNSNYVYGVVEAGGQVFEMVYTTNAGSSWSYMTEPVDADSGVPSTDYSRGQAWYDLILAVHPTNPSMVFAGGIDLFRTSNSGTSWTQISHWYGGFGYGYVHADQHQMVFRPGNPNHMLFGNDGGVYYTSDATASAPTIDMRNLNYGVTQFYACALHPSANSNYALAGAQDNGTQQFSVNGKGPTVEATGGDGAFCFIDQNNPNVQITSYVYNNYWRSLNGGSSFQSPRFFNDGSTGRFINPADYDDNLDILYSAETSTSIARVTGVSGTPSIGSVSVSGMGDMASHLRVSPYSTTSTTLFVGTGSGDLFKITNANTTSPSVANIGASLPAGYISCVEIGASDNELLVTYKNYGVTSVWYTSNGGSTWVNKEGNLPDMPVRWALFNPNNRNEVILATEVGVWSTTALQNATPTWISSSGGLANVRVDMLQIRDSDDEVIAATYGRGLFTSNGFALPAVPVANFSASPEVVCVGETVSFIDSSTGVPTSYSWTISPSTYSYVNGTSGTSSEPDVQFSAAGTYTVTLNVSNAQGSDSKTRTQYIQVGGLTLPFTEDFENGMNRWSIVNPDGGRTWVLTNAPNSSSTNTAVMVENYFYNAAGQRDGLITPPLDLTNYTSANISFEYAFRRYSSSYNDSLAVFVSMDCGTTWNRLASYKEDGSGNYATGSDFTNSFTPSSAADWCGGSNVTCPSLSLNAFVGNAGVLVKFENICDYGNNFYLDNVNITGVQSSAPTAAFSLSSTTICASDSILLTDLSTSSPSAWTWSVSPSVGVSFVNGTNATSQNPYVKVDSAGTYSITLIAANSTGADTLTQTASLTVNPVVIPSATLYVSDTTVCEYQYSGLAALATNVGSGATYSFYINGVQIASSGPAANRYNWSAGDSVYCIITVTNPCSPVSSIRTPAVHMQVDTGLVPVYTITHSADTTCGLNAVTHSISISNAGPNPLVSWVVNGSQTLYSTNFSYTTTRTSSYEIKAIIRTDESCTQDVYTTADSIYVESVANPAVTLTPPVNICPGTNVVFSASGSNGGTGAYYEWLLNGATVGGNTSSYTLNNVSGGEVVSVKYHTTQTCQLNPYDSAGFVVPIFTNDSALVTLALDTGLVNNFCDGDPVSFIATAQNSGTFPQYTWLLNGVAQGAPSNNATRTFSQLNNGDEVRVVLVSNHPCTPNSTDTSDVFTVVVHPLPTVAFTTTSPSTPLCSGDSLELVATPSGGQFTGTGVVGNWFYADLAGSGNRTIQYEYQDPSTGCSNTATVTIAVEIVPIPQIGLSGGVLQCFNSNFIYQWHNVNGVINGATSQNYTPTSNGKYCVSISKSNCVEFSDSVDVTGIGVPEWTGVQALSLYPNPTQRILHLKMTSAISDRVTISISDAKGAIVLTKMSQLIVGENVVEFDLLNWTPGVYTMQINGVSGMAVRTFEVNP